jgi:hypothetical protein
MSGSFANPASGSGVTCCHNRYHKPKPSQLIETITQGFYLTGRKEEKKGWMDGRVDNG